MTKYFSLRLHFQVNTYNARACLSQWHVGLFPVQHYNLLTVFHLLILLMWRLQSDWYVLFCMCGANGLEPSESKIDELVSYFVLMKIQNCVEKFHYVSFFTCMHYQKIIWICFSKVNIYLKYKILYLWFFNFK